MAIQVRDVQHTIGSRLNGLLDPNSQANDGKMKPTLPAPCRIAPKDADLPEISLTENVMRVPMHPADEFEAFQRLITAGKSAADVAARFGVNEAVVLRRHRAVRFEPVLYRDGELHFPHSVCGSGTPASSGRGLLKFVQGVDSKAGPSVL